MRIGFIFVIIWGAKSYTEYGREWGILLGFGPETNELLPKYYWRWIWKFKPDWRIKNEKITNQ